MKRIIFWLVLLASAPLSVAAETMYVSDQVTVPIRAEASATAAVVKTVSTGAALEVTEQRAGFVRVRDAEDAEGWVEATMLSTQPPAANQVRAVRAELDRTRTQLVQAQTQLDKQRAAAASSGVEPLQSELASTRAELAKAQAALKNSEAAANAAAPTAPADKGAARAEGSGFSVLWLVIGFAMLVVGFIGGVVWVKESIRRRMGGLYLRI
jgi:SH3 domain protein